MCQEYEQKSPSLLEVSPNNSNKKLKYNKNGDWNYNILETFTVADVEWINPLQKQTTFIQ